MASQSVGGYSGLIEPSLLGAGEGNEVQIVAVVHHRIDALGARLAKIGFVNLGGPLV